jgi:predicted methyltransferase
MFADGFSKILTCIAALALCACGGENMHTTAESATARTDTGPAVPGLEELLASDFRSTADRGRDARRKPAEVLAFLGIQPGMNVMDVIAAGGWYTEVLALAVGPGGRVSAQNPQFVLTFRDGAMDRALSARLANNRLPNVSRLDREFADMTPADGVSDAALTALNLHDVYNDSGEDAAVGMLRVVYSMLKPGGVFGVIDHEGAEGRDNAAVHRMLKADAIRIAEAAGFVVEGDSDILQVADDDHTQHVYADGRRGNTDRFLLKLRRPQ